jgi:DNA-directed RNA polymerase beta subunit
MYESIVSGSNDIKTGTPEAFNVLVRELRGLGLAMTPKKID